MPSQGSDEPDKKRIRFDIASKSDSPSDHKRTALSAKDVVHLRFLNSLSDFDERGAAAHHPPALTSHPTYLHQIIPNEHIHGYQSATFAIYIHVPTLSSWIDSDFVSLPPNSNSNPNSNTPLTDPTDVPALLTPFIKSGLSHSRQHFISTISAPVHLPLSNQVAAYERHGRRYAIYKEKFFDIDSAGGILRRDAFHDFHRRMAFLMFVHIDGASFIDDEDPRWEVFVTAELSNDNNPVRFIGYATTYPFSVLTKQETKGMTFADRIRISQVLVLPIAQRAGHGGQILSAIYADAHRRKAFEVTVEDPGRSFRILRDVTDLRNAYEAHVLRPSVSILDADEKTLLDDLHKTLLLTHNQARRCLEVHQLRITDRADKEEYKKYRLWVKRRLFKENMEVLDRFDGEEKKEKLAQIYGDYEEEYMQSAARTKTHTYH